MKAVWRSRICSPTSTGGPIDSVIKDEQMKKIRDLQDFVKNQPATITEFDETLVSRLIAKITVFDDHFTVEFKSGITINIEA